MQSRRKFIQHTGQLALGTGLLGSLPLELIAAQRRYTSPNERIGVGLIGCNGMGFVDLQSFLKNSPCFCAALCDVDSNVLNRRKADLEKAGFPAPKQYQRYQDLLADPAVDVVVIGTPDHWHCLQFLDALSAGKDIYVEKPIGNSIAEANAMELAAIKSGRVIQVGQWQRSQPHLEEARQYLKSGKLGRIRSTKAWAYVGWKSILSKAPDGPAPAGVDYDLWLGPAPKRPFNPNRFHGSFRWYWDYAGGVMTDWGVHMIDTVLQFMEAEMPLSVMASGGKLAYPDDDQETPDTLTTVYGFRDFSLVWEHALGIGIGNFGRGQGAAFLGENATLVISRGDWEVIPHHKSIEAVPVQKAQGPSGLDLHVQNFLEAVKVHEPEAAKAAIGIGSMVCAVSQMGNIAYRTGQALHWDNEKGKFKEKEANGYLKKEYHNGYKFVSEK
jgi:predicted dehydrogenase